MILKYFLSGTVRFFIKRRFHGNNIYSVYFFVLRLIHFEENFKSFVLIGRGNKALFIFHVILQYINY